MHRTTILLPHALKLKVESIAKERGVSMGKFIRDALVGVLRQANARGIDPFVADKTVYRGPAPKDLAENHDQYLYGEVR